MIKNEDFTGSAVCRDPPWSVHFCVFQRAEANSTAPTTVTTTPTSVSTSEPTKSGCGGPALSTLLLSPLLLAALLFHAWCEGADTAQPPRVDWRRIFSFITDSVFFLFFFFFLWSEIIFSVDGKCFKRRARRPDWLRSLRTGGHTGCFSCLLSSRCKLAQRPGGAWRHSTCEEENPFKVIVHERVLYFRPDFSNFIQRIKL